MSLFSTNTFASGIPLVIPTQTQQPTARLVLRNNLGQVIQQWLVKQNKCTLGSAVSCSLRCELPGIAPYHALLVIGARQIFIRALAPKLTRDGRQFNEILLTDEHSHFEIAGHRFELSRSSEVGATSSSKPTSIGKERMKFTLARPYELNNRRAQTPLPTTISEVTNESVSTALDRDMKRVSQLLQAAIQPIESQLHNLIEPLAQLQSDSRRQKRLRKKRRSSKREKQSMVVEATDEITVPAQAIDPQFTKHVEEIVSKHAAAMDVLAERITGVNLQLSAIERIIAEEHAANEQKSTEVVVDESRTAQSLAIEQVQSGIVAVAAALESLQAKQASDQTENLNWKTGVQQQLESLTHLIDSMSDRFLEIVQQIQQSRIAAEYQESRSNETTVAAGAMPDQSGHDAAWKIENTIVQQPTQETGEPVPASLTHEWDLVGEQTSDTPTDDHEVLAKTHSNDSYENQWPSAEHDSQDDASSPWDNGVQADEGRLEELSPVDTAADTDDQDLSGFGEATSTLPFDQPSQGFDQEFSSRATLEHADETNENNLDAWHAGWDEPQFEAPRLEEDEFLFGGESAAWSPFNEEPVNEEPVNVEPVNVEPVNEEPVNLEPVNVEPVNVEPTSSYEGTCSLEREELAEETEASEQADGDLATAEIATESERGLHGAETEGAESVQAALPSWWVDESNESGVDNPVAAKGRITDEFGSVSPAATGGAVLSAFEEELTAEALQSVDDAAGVAPEAVVIDEQSEAEELEEFYGLGAGSLPVDELLASEQVKEDAFVEPEFAPKIATESNQEADVDFFELGVGSPEAAREDDLQLGVVELHADVAERTPLASTSSASSEPTLAETEVESDESEDDSVEDYMKKLLARMRGVPEDEVEMPQPQATPKPVSSVPARETVRAEAAPATVRNTESPITVHAEEEGTKPFDPTKYMPRALAPEHSQNLAAMRELANSSARTAIHKSTRQRHLSGILLKACISLVGLIVGGVLIAINGLNVNIGLVATIASFFVGVIWGYDCITSIKPLVQSGLILKPQQADASKPTFQK